MVMIVSPQRGSSFQHFIEKAQKYFLCKSIENYDEFVWSNYNKVLSRNLLNFWKLGNILYIHDNI